MLQNNKISTPVLFDGAMGTILHKTTKEYHAPPDLFNLTDPETVIKIHREYIDAGSKIILTNTFGANRLRLANNSISFKLPKINSIGVHLAHEAAKGTNVLIAGNIGPTGIPGNLINDDTSNMISQTFIEQAQYLVDSGIDLLVLETFSTQKEALLALVSIKKITSLPVIVLLSILHNNKTSDNFSIEYVFKELENHGAASIGLNCSNGAKQILQLIKNLYFANTIPITVKPSAGIPETTKTQLSYPEDPNIWSDNMTQIADLGACFLGGCCGTTPEHLRSLAKKLLNKK